MNSTQSQLSELLGDHQILGEPFPVEPGSIMHRYGYDVYPVAPDGHDSNTVVIDLYGDSTETTHIVHQEMTLRVQAIQGEGEVIVLSPDGQQRIHALGKEIGAVVIGPGDTYRYIRTSLGSLAILDTASPPYMPGYEISFEEVSPDDGLQSGMDLMLWSPWEPGEKHRSGMHRLRVGDYHDTTVQNSARAGIRGFRGEPPHHHGELMSHGSDEWLPVNVQLVDGAYKIDHRRLPGEPSLSPDLPRIDIQPHAKIFRRVGIGA